ncbi:cysteine desulfurase family protein [Pelovirga terrestris]|uniref:cysteine desulfurase n=1 Tax=Pelovirga terrestris TaxID=2771352 RepID=A0A8J6QPU3_9BACT|nr:aminotransferase class V-fold PLP-dependent enzyme [Pelovirga terrestris]MBD1399685.1 aminotransferase class V-fold PLP-dependent enzyme [Pelovirga terrestris]
MSIYLDCASTTPVEPAVAQIVRRFTEEDYGNAASPIHDYGCFARMAVDHARGQIAKLVKTRRDDVILTSGATEANNLALLGLREYGLKTGRRHLICSAIEHKAVLEPLEALTKTGFELTVIPVGSDGRILIAALRKALRPDTLLVSTMQVNNETGMIQPLAEIAEVLADHSAFWHVDAAQGFGKELDSITHPRIDLISISGHKIYGPKGIGALITRKRHSEPPPLKPLMFGGDQEQGLRPGTLPVALIAGLGEAARCALRDHSERLEKVRHIRARALSALAPLLPVINGDPAYCLPHVINISLPGIPSVTAIRALAKVIAISSTSACTSHHTAPSHVLNAMGCSEAESSSALRLSWCHLTDDVDWDTVVTTLKQLQYQNPF